MAAERRQNAFLGGIFLGAMATFVFMQMISISTEPRHVVPFREEVLDVRNDVVPMEKKLLPRAVRSFVTDRALTDRRRTSSPASSTSPGIKTTHPSSSPSPTSIASSKRPRAASRFPPTHPSSIHSTANALVLIDEAVLNCLTCPYPNGTVDYLVFGKPEIRNPKKMNLYYGSDDPSKDYFLLLGNGTERAVRKFRWTLYTLDNRQFYIPKDVNSFLFDWRRSRFIRCQNIDMKRSGGRQVVPLEAVEHFVKLRDMAASYGSTLMLNGGTHLGWYRECTIIPHTPDSDFHVLQEEHNPELLRALETSDLFSVYYSFGVPSDCFQLKLCTSLVKIDFFYLYVNTTLDRSYICGTSTPKRVRFAYPVITKNDICVGDLLGKLMFVPCESEAVVEMGFGKEWRRDWDSNDFAWDNDGTNVMMTEWTNSSYPSWYHRRPPTRCPGFW
uniref:F-box domain-containing protein n=1 Tax=Steinernema glaseri TaxID=37863 RepID=A0A1I7YS20_9BILA